MSTFRGNDETLEAEIATLEAMAKVRLRRVTREMRELDRDLRELKRERARRRALADVPAAAVAETAHAEGSV
ncbi:MAG TPA: hypothetical protein VGV89_01960 [Thermoplasmata archaeon]|nr:hypothetical protein [Thermoplasmata archaeon]